LAEQAIARDLEEGPHDDRETPVDDDSEEETLSDESTIRPGAPGCSAHVSMVGSDRTLTAIGASSRATAAAVVSIPSRNPAKTERHKARREERSLLRDNHLTPPRHAAKRETFLQWLGRKLPSVMLSREKDAPKAVDTDALDAGSEEREQAGADETAPLLDNPNLPYGGQDTPAKIDNKWDEAVLRGEIRTTWQREAKVLVRYSAPLILTFMLQYSLNVTSVFAVGHIGKIELGAVSLASMTSNITGYAVYQGLATSLDTLCAQAYGSGRKKLVGLQTQRMVGPFRSIIPNLTRSS
jgi:MATE family multidrug resistance protein